MKFGWAIIMLPPIWIYSNRKKLLQVASSCNLVLTAAAMLDIKYPKEAGIKHKILNAYDIPTYKMTKHFDEAYKFIK